MQPQDVVERRDINNNIIVYSIESHLNVLRLSYEITHRSMFDHGENDDIYNWDNNPMGMEDGSLHPEEMEYLLRDLAERFS